MAFLQGLDVARASARRLGTCLVDDGALDDPADIFFLTKDEVCAGRWEGARDLVALRRARHEEYERLDLPVSWQGMPEPRPVEMEDAAGAQGSVLGGVGASPGVIEGVVRVVTDSSDANVEPGEIVVAHTTDPSWALVLFMSSALVVDIGGRLSHAAIVARELGVPCVVDTKVGTRFLRTGDRCRVDGDTGQVELLERAGSPLS
jgi:pyruvate,water dikinase